MLYEKFGLVNTAEMFAHAMAHRYAVGAFNFYNMETLVAISAAARETRSPIILAVSESALEYMGDDMLMAMIAGLGLSPNEQVALHLDHGHSFESCAHAIDIGFSSVMIDASGLPFDENIALSARVAQYAHARGATVEATCSSVPQDGALVACVVPWDTDHLLPPPLFPGARSALCHTFLQCWCCGHFD